MGHVAALILASGLLAGQAAAQTTTLPKVDVQAPAWSREHGGYLVSGDFRVDPVMSAVVYPAQALVEGDILSVQPVHLNDDDYLVLQECASADCTSVGIVRVWNAQGSATLALGSENRIRIKHGNRYFLWLKRLPSVAFSPCGAGCGTHFDTFQTYGPPLVLRSVGTLAAYKRAALRASETTGPVPVASHGHEGTAFVVTYEGGSRIRVERMHALRTAE
jgi:hypothetical protein